MQTKTKSLDKKLIVQTKIDSSDKFDSLDKN